MSEKLQKVLARKGLGSRRALEELIAAGRVTVNGATAQLGDRVDDQVTVCIDSKVVLRPGEGTVACRVLMYHKPEGELTTLKDPEDRPTVFDHLPSLEKGRWIYIGRLDINTSGLLLFTTDGTLANALMHPRHGVERVYAARVYGDVTEELIAQLEHEVTLEDGKAHFDKVQYAGGEGRNMWFHCSLKEGRKREVRRLWEAVGCKVSRLIRISYGGIRLDPKLKSGEFRDLTLREVNTLRKLASMDPLNEDDYLASIGKDDDFKQDVKKNNFAKEGRKDSRKAVQSAQRQGVEHQDRQRAQKHKEKRSFQKDFASFDHERKTSRSDFKKSPTRFKNKERKQQVFGNSEASSFHEGTFSKGNSSYGKANSKEFSLGQGKRSSKVSFDKYERRASDDRKSNFSFKSNRNSRASSFAKRTHGFKH